MGTDLRISQHFRAATIAAASIVVAVLVVAAKVPAKQSSVTAQSAGTLINVSFGPQQIWRSGVQISSNGNITPCLPGAGSPSCPVSGAGVALNLNTQCPPSFNTAKGSASCVEQAMQQQVASPDAIAFYTLTGRILLDFESEGTVNLGTVVHDIWCCTADTDDSEPVLLGGVPAVIYPFKEISTVPLKSYPGYADATSRFPQLLVFGFDAMSFEQASTSPEGGQRFVFDMRLTNGGHCCDTGLVARAAFDFGADGSFMQALPLNIAPAGGS